MRLTSGIIFVDLGTEYCILLPFLWSLNLTFNTSGCWQFIYSPKTCSQTKTYRTFCVDQRLRIPERDIYTYPDVVVVEKPIQLQTGRTDTIMNLCFIAEALSKSTQDYDRGEKFVAYRTIENFQEYLFSISTGFMSTTTSKLRHISGFCQNMTILRSLYL